ncbi:Integrase [Streptomyces griseus]|uniref:Integrase n=1 Tax=Streptomyces griseus TaxID=1911 RepID=A0A380N9L7_STRGR|nr:Integrase [Streptomyces griseus]
MENLPRQPLGERVRQTQRPRQERQGGPARRRSGPAELHRPAPNRRWLTDITEHATGEGKLYLCAVKDVYSGRIVATPSTRDEVQPRCVRPGIRGCPSRPGRRMHRPLRSADLHFRARKYVAVLARHSLVGSMGRAGAAGNNAAMENFFALLQKNVLDRRSWANHQELRIAIVAWIERAYHRRRRQRRLARLTPVDYEPIMTHRSTRYVNPNCHRSRSSPSPSGEAPAVSPITVDPRTTAAGPAGASGGPRLRVLLRPGRQRSLARSLSHPGRRGSARRPRPRPHLCRRR